MTFFKKKFTKMKLINKKHSCNKHFNVRYLNANFTLRVSMSASLHVHSLSLCIKCSAWFFTSCCGSKYFTFLITFKLYYSLKVYDISSMYFNGKKRTPELYILQIKE